MVGLMTKKLDAVTEYLPPSAVAQLLGVSTRTVTRMADTGSIKSIKLPSGHRRYLRSEVEKLAAPVTKGNAR